MSLPTNVLYSIPLSVTLSHYGRENHNDLCSPFHYASLLAPLAGADYLAAFSAGDGEAVQQGYSLPSRQSGLLQSIICQLFSCI